MMGYESYTAAFGDKTDNLTNRQIALMAACTMNKTENLTTSSWRAAVLDSAKVFLEFLEER